MNRTTPQSGMLALFAVFFGSSALAAEEPGDTVVIAVSAPKSVADSSIHPSSLILHPSVNAGAPPLLPSGRVTILKFRNLVWSPDGKSFRSKGRVEIAFKDAKTDAVTMLSAENVQVQTDTGQVVAEGGALLQRPDGRITGKQVVYNFNSRAGYITDAIADTDYFRMSGKRIETQADGSYVLTDGAFTTCSNGLARDKALSPEGNTARERSFPGTDYHIRAARLTVNPQRFVSGKRVTFYAGKTKLFTLPSYKKDLRTATIVPVILPSYNHTDGFGFRYRDTPINQKNEIEFFDLRANAHRPNGFFGYEQGLTPNVTTPLPKGVVEDQLTYPLRGYLDSLNPPTYRQYVSNLYGVEASPRESFIAALQLDEGVINRRRSDLYVSRFPEVGIRFANIFGHSPPATNPGQRNAPLVGDTEAAITRVPRAPFILNVLTFADVAHERPTGVTAGRLGARIELATQPILVGKRISLRFGASDTATAYTGGSAYNLLSPEVELNYVPTRTSLFGIGYRYLTDVGETPFVFDHRDLRHELRLRYQVGGPWGFGILAREDLERTRFYDTEFAVIRNFDCMQVGLAYNTYNSSVQVIFNILPPFANHASYFHPLPVPRASKDGDSFRTADSDAFLSPPSFSAQIETR